MTTTYQADFRLVSAIADNRALVRQVIFELREGRRTAADQDYMDRCHIRLKWRWDYYRRMTNQRERERAEFYQASGAKRVFGQIKQDVECTP